MRQLQGRGLHLFGTYKFGCEPVDGGCAEDECAPEDPDIPTEDVAADFASAGVSE